MAEVFEDEQEKSSPATAIEDTLGGRAMQCQILHPFPIQSQPWFDVCVLGVSRSGIRVSLLDFVGAFAIDLRQHRLKRYTENGALRPTPAASVRERLGKFEDLPRKFHV